MKFAHLADAHLGFEQYNQSWRADDFARAFRRAVERIIEEGVEFVVIAGDLFHRSIPNPRTIKEAVDSLNMLKKEEITVFAVEGNHDKSARGVSIYHLLESLGLMNVVGFRDRRVENEYLSSYRIGNVYLVKGHYGGVEIVGDKHRTRWQLEKTLDFLKPESERSVLVLHQSVKEVVDVEMKTAYELTLNDLPEAGYYAFGHIHIPKVYSFDGRFIAYPGCLERYDSREASKFVVYDEEKIVKEGVGRGFYIVENFKPRFVEIETRGMLNFSIVGSSVEEVEKGFHEVLSEAGKEDVVIGRIICREHLDIKKFVDYAMKRAKYAEIRSEIMRKREERIELKREDEFFTDFELKLLEILRSGEVDTAMELIKTHFGLIEDEGKKEWGEKKHDKEHDKKEKEKEDVKSKGEESRKKNGKSRGTVGKTIFDFIE